ncbi:hypothetical protein SAMN05892877_11426 [Rhizobium subbaraonis]|uniref:Uncharacterized protein n=1 Tax=Rhizobium subbaraonis TaxID=908946 RepID=A0A285UTJ8_9HYPH|nr:hypothetical protein [Rhizobium subbaraonis]SOC45152.1 hypothetical protein SAMN05892877_11426 [Rhizobium subbaraonis]
MGPFVFFVCAAVAMIIVFATLKGRGDPVGWWLGLAHGALCLLALAGWAATRDANFAVPMALLAIYGGATCINEIVA